RQDSAATLLVRTPRRRSSPRSRWRTRSTCDIPFTTPPSPMSSDTSPRLTRADVERAAERLHGHVRRTPMLVLDREPDRPQIALKLECLQVSGSFKIRGATNRILLDGGRHERVVATSGGNHGIAVAHVSRRLGLRADLFVTPHAPAYKMRAIEAAGARVHRADPSQDLVSVAREFAEEHSALYVHSFDDPGVVAGQGTLGLEILEEHPDATHVVLAVGGGGLGAGIAVAVGERVRLVPVEPSLCPTLAAALEAGHPVPVEVGGVAADALGALRLSELAYALLSPL